MRSTKDIHLCGAPRSRRSRSVARAVIGTGDVSLLSARSLRSVLGFGSVGSILSIASAGSILSIGSVGSILGIGAAGANPSADREEDGADGP